MNGKHTLFFNLRLRAFTPRARLFWLFYITLTSSARIG